MAFSAALEPRPGRSEVRTLYDSFEIFGKEGTWTYIVGRLSRPPEPLRGITLPHFKLCGFAGFNSHASLAIRAKKKGSECGWCFWSLPQRDRCLGAGARLVGQSATWSIKQRRTCAAVRTTVRKCRPQTRSSLVADHRWHFRDTHFAIDVSRAMPSPDGRYWRCIWNGEIKCFFAPFYSD